MNKSSSVMPTSKLQIFNWADEIEEINKKHSQKTENKQLQENVAHVNIPQKPPFTIYISNVPYDAREAEIVDLFRNLRIVSIKIPQDNRFQKMFKIKGFGYIEFETREDLIKALSYPTITLKNRVIKVELANSHKLKGASTPESSKTKQALHLNEQSDIKVNNGNKNSNNNAKYSRSKSTWRTDPRPVNEHRRYNSCVRVDNNRPSTVTCNNSLDLYGRPKLSLKPRTLPFQAGQLERRFIQPIFPTHDSIFGNATPVDTRAKERLIEDRLHREIAHNYNKSKRHHSKTYTSKTIPKYEENCQ